MTIWYIFGSVHNDFLIEVQNYFKFISFPLLFMEQFSLNVFRQPFGYTRWLKYVKIQFHSNLELYMR